MLPHLPAHLVHRAAPSPDASLFLRYLGTAGFVLRLAQRTLVLDPFVTRPGVLRTLFGRLRPDAARIRGMIPHADEVLVGHAHHDHVLDAPELCRQTGARLIGSPAVIHVGRAAGLPPSQLVETRGREDIDCGGITVRGLPSRHGRVYANRVTLPGDILEPPPWPPRVFHLRHGLVLNWYIEGGGYRIVHVDTAEIVEQELEGLRADVVCLCAIGRRYRPNYVADVVRLLAPRFIVACHWDLFTTPYESPRLLPGVDLEGFCDEIRAAGCTPVVLPFDGVLGVSPADLGLDCRAETG